MFDTLIHTKVARDGKVRLELPSSLPPDSEVDVTVSVRVRRRFADAAEWRAHVDKVAGSVPDIKRPEPWELTEVPPL